MMISAESAGPMSGRARVLQVVGAYDSWLVRTYCWLRFGILRQRFLDEIGQYLPTEGRILDVGCGFGLFSLYYALTSPRLELHGIDLNARRIEQAKTAAARLGLRNVRYDVGDVTKYADGARLDAVYMLDIIHHIPRETVQPLIQQLSASLPPASRLLIKDVDRRPAYKRWFTYILDKAMDRKAAVNYWDPDDLQEVLTDAGFRVYRHLMVDVLPYPHIIYVCEKRARPADSAR